MRYGSSRAFPVVGVIGLVVFALLSQLAVDWIGSQIVMSGYPVWLPHLQTVGETVYAYSLGAAVISYLVVPISIFAVGYHYGRARS